MCKVQNCHEKHEKHYCSICQNADSTHFSFHCPLSAQGFYGTTAEIAYKIKDHGFLPSYKGTSKEGIYFFRTMDQAKAHAQQKYKNAQVMVIECKIPTNSMTTENFHIANGDSEDIVKQKLFQWYSKAKDLEEIDVKIPWEKKTCVKHNKNIKIIKLHEIK